MFMLGLAAGAVSGAATTPLDVVKTRLQTQPSGNDRQYTGVWQCLRTIVREEGARALFKGMVPRVIWVAPASAITLSVYEALVAYVQPHRGDMIM